ncbi:MAG: hypothetical protein WC096_02335 [Sphaerochaetaceae bacterium]
MRKRSIEACLLRGACGNLIVHASEANPRMVLSPLPLAASSIPLWHEELRLWSKKTTLYPETVGFSDGDVFSLGTNYDEACRGEGVSSIFDLPPSDEMEDVVRDKVALVIACPEKLSRILSGMGSFLVLSGVGSEKLASDLNWEVCITVALGHGQKADLTNWLCEETGGADYVVQPLGDGQTPDPEILSMLRLRGGKFFAVVDDCGREVPDGVIRIVGDEPKRMMKGICAAFRDLGGECKRCMM